MPLMSCEERAHQIYLVLAARVAGIPVMSPSSVKVTYGEVGDWIGLKPNRFGKALEAISDYCKRKKISELNCIVVNKVTKEVGDEAPDPVDPNTKKTITPTEARSLILIRRKKWLVNLPRPSDFRCK